jgi:XkdW protein
MMTLYEKIKAIYPELQDADFMTVIALQNDSDGKGDYIAAWDHPTLARPTEEQLNDTSS